MMRMILSLVLVILIGLGAYFAYDAFAIESTTQFSAVSTDRSYGFVSQNADLYGERNASNGLDRIVQRFFAESAMDDEPICPLSISFPDVKAVTQDPCLPSKHGYLALVLDEPTDEDPTQLIETHPANRSILVLGFTDPSEAVAFSDLLIEQLNVSPSYAYSEVLVGHEFIGERWSESDARVMRHTGWNETIGYRHTLIVVDRAYVFIARSLSEEQTQTYDLRAVTSDDVYTRFDS